MASTHDVLSDPSPGKEEEELYREMFGVSAVDNREFLNIGAGRFKHAAWRNVDYWQSGYENLLKYSKPDIDHDLSKCEPINVPDQSIHIVYTSHTIEHLLDHHVSYVFNDVFRMLRSGGLIRVVCPSADLAYYAFLRNDMRYFRTFTTVRVGGAGVRLCDKFRPLPPGSDIYDAFLGQFARQVVRNKEKRNIAIKLLKSESLSGAMSKIAAMCFWDEHIKSPGDHINWFTESKLHSMLDAAGFRTIFRMGYSQSLFPVLRNRAYFDGTRPNFSIYMEAVKD